MFPKKICQIARRIKNIRQQVGVRFSTRSIRYCMRILYNIEKQKGDDINHPALYARHRNNVPDIRGLCYLLQLAQHKENKTMYARLANLRIATRRMIAEHVWMYAFDFSFNEVRTYAFLFRIPDGKNDTFAVSFVDKDDTSRHLSCPIDSNNIAATVSAIFNFFRIRSGFDDRQHMRELIALLYTKLNTALLSARKPDAAQILASRESAAGSSGDGIYLCGLRRTGHRTEQNTEKAKRYCKDVFDIFGVDPGISFCFSEDPEKQVSTHQICERLARNSSR